MKNFVMAPSLAVLSGPCCSPCRLFRQGRFMGRQGKCGKGWFSLCSRLDCRRKLQFQRRKGDTGISQPPQRVVAVWQNSIETLLALGVGDRLEAAIGVPDEKYISPAYREAYRKVPYKSLRDLDLETILMMKPDLVVGWFSTFQPKVLRSTGFGMGVVFAPLSRRHPFRQFPGKQWRWNMNRFCKWAGFFKRRNRRRLW